MKTKKRVYLVLLLSLLVSLFLLCFGIRDIHKAYAEGTPTTETTVVSEDTTIVKESNTEISVWNSKVKAWLDTVLGGAGITLDVLLIAILSKKNKQSVAVTVNDSTTQEKLDMLNTEYTNIKQLLVDMFQLTKGTLDILSTLYSNNKSIDENARDAIKSITINSEDIVKDVNDILNADVHKKVKTTLHSISNIVLG